MPIKDLQKRRLYFKRYMRARRAGAGRADRTAVKPDVEAGAGQPVKPSSQQTERTLDWSKPFHVEGRYPYPGYLCQDDGWFDASGNFIKPRPR